ncbi:hypothetical protein VTJ83DRAFT_3120 [Remersonia thermophila]|uniref:Uncharacterized protein n=1 Tax=Remersonia thermophila TaxID=72144 RepID=A0ABR4DFE1_9PEZI
MQHSLDAYCAVESGNGAEIPPDPTLDESSDSCVSQAVINPLSPATPSPACRAIQTPTAETATANEDRDTPLPSIEASPPFHTSSGAKRGKKRDFDKRSTDDDDGEEDGEEEDLRSSSASRYASTPTIPKLAPRSQGRKRKRVDDISYKLAEGLRVLAASNRVLPGEDTVRHAVTLFLANWRQKLPVKARTAVIKKLTNPMWAAIWPLLDKEEQAVFIEQWRLP